MGRGWGRGGEGCGGDGCGRVGEEGRSGDGRGVKVGRGWRRGWGKEGGEGWEGGVGGARRAAREGFGGVVELVHQHEVWGECGWPLDED